jgi:GT2 family glycosyltransferase
MKPISNLLVSVVMLSYNRRQDVSEGIHQLLLQSYQPLEIIVVDNGSHDGTAEMLQTEFPTVQCLALPQNIGVAAYNSGFKAATGEYIIILDDDSFPEKTAISRMVERFAENPQVGIVAFDVRNYSEFTAGLSISKKKKTSSSFRYQMAFNGAGVGIRKAIIDQVGGYPEEYFLYWNEQDLAIRVLNAGYQLITDTDIISFHKYSPTNRQSLRAPFYYTRNLFWLIWKYYPAGKMTIDTLRMMYYCFYYSLEQKNWVYVKAFFQAVWNIRSIKRFPIKPIIIKKLRLTYKLAFIYFQ